MNQKISVCFAGLVCLFLPAVCLGQATSFTISTVVGNTSISGSSGAGFTGDGSPATNAKLNSPIQLALDSSGNLYIADSANNRIRKVTASTGKISTIAGGSLAGWTGDGAAATSAELNDPEGIFVDSSGNLFIGDLLNDAVREISTSGIINTVAGCCAGTPDRAYSGDGGPATSAALDYPLGLAVDSSGKLYIADSFNHRIRIVTPDGNIATYAGLSPAGGYSGDGGPATSANLNRPFGVCVDAAGNLYIADNENHRIRKVTAQGTITTVAGTGTAGSAGDGGPATKAQLNRPYDVKVDSAGDLYIADYGNSRIRMVTPDGVIRTIAGGSGPGYNGDGGSAVGAQINQPTGIALAANGTIYIADSANNVVRLLTPTAPSVGGGGVVSAGNFGAFPAIAPGSWIEIYGTNLSSDTRSWGAGDFQGNNAPTSLDGTSVSIGGQAAFVDYISGGQVNAQVPSGVATGTETLTVKTPSGTSTSYSVTVNSTEPGMLAPPGFNIGGTQYLVAQFTDGTYVLPPGAIAGVNSRRAKGGVDTIVIYGIGFGPVNPNVPAGQIVPTPPPSLMVAPQILFGSTPATVVFAGLASGYVGLYQFNVAVPSITASDKVPVTFTLGGVPGTQTFYTAVQ